MARPMTREQADTAYDAAREAVAKAMRRMIEAHDSWYVADRAGDHPVTVEIRQRRWEAFQQASGEWHVAMAQLQVARRRADRLREAEAQQQEDEHDNQ